MKRFALTLIALATLGTGSFAIAKAPQDMGKPGPWMYDRDEPGVYSPDWDTRPDPDRGACFYTNAHFTGHRFCVTAGQRLAYLPKGFGDRISSIRTFGGGEVTVYGKRKFEGKRDVMGTMEDLGETGGGGHRGWNDRISSISVH